MILSIYTDISAIISQIMIFESIYADASAFISPKIMIFGSIYVDASAIISQILIFVSILLKYTFHSKTYFYEFEKRLQSQLQSYMCKRKRFFQIPSIIFANIK